MSLLGMVPGSVCASAVRRAPWKAPLSGSSVRMAVYRRSPQKVYERKTRANSSNAV